MEYIYAALLINKAGGTINETTLKTVLEAAGSKADEAKLRAIVAALDGVDIQDAIKNAAAMPAASAAPAAASAAPKKEEAKEEKNEEAAAEGLGSLFG